MEGQRVFHESTLRKPYLYLHPLSLPPSPRVQCRSICSHPVMAGQLLYMNWMDYWHIEKDNDVPQLFPQILSGFLEVFTTPYNLHDHLFIAKSFIIIVPPCRKSILRSMAEKASNCRRTLTNVTVSKHNGHVLLHDSSNGGKHSSGLAQK